MEQEGWVMLYQYMPQWQIYVIFTTINLLLTYAFYKQTKAVGGLWVLVCFMSMPGTAMLIAISILIRTSKVHYMMGDNSYENFWRRIQRKQP